MLVFRIWFVLFGQSVCRKKKKETQPKMECIIFAGGRMLYAKRRKTRREKELTAFPFY